MPRFYCPAPLATGASLDLPAGPARHVQVLRMQPGQTITLFNGQGGEFEATIERMSRSDVAVVVGTHDPVEREAARAVHLVLGMPANDRMDWLVEKAAELGVASIQPLVTERSVLRLTGERADKKRAHWHAVGVAACEQSGRNRVPEVHAVRSFGDWVASADGGFLLSLRTGSQPMLAALSPSGPIHFLSGPEGGLSPSEEDAAIARGYRPVTLANRVLRSETAPLAALAQLQF
ncbi:16S rRNA (uracil(1498)-N(3))-methyltransferase [Rhodoferax sp.]|uniref:16S rRNA (uracil(1498)-N(3))-methyltransferase n=1 Tax=Rhodoferax sp. TaxID=50421 RepID=UPI0025F9606B|nr:16S rRNA (uracil(1498)-N(3))-methyltransferase [Rhodoferax sp.]